MGGGDYRSVGEEFRGRLRRARRPGSASRRARRGQRQRADGICADGLAPPSATRASTWFPPPSNGVSARSPPGTRTSLSFADIRSERYNPAGRPGGGRLPVPVRGRVIRLRLPDVRLHPPAPRCRRQVPGGARKGAVPGGRCLPTYFLINEEALRAMGGPGQFSLLRRPAGGRLRCRSARPRSAGRRPRAPRAQRPSGRVRPPRIVVRTRALHELSGHHDLGSALTLPAHATHRSVLILAPEPLTESATGPAQRAVKLAEAVAEHCQVTLAAPAPSVFPDGPFRRSRPVRNTISGWRARSPVTTSPSCRRSHRPASSSRRAGTCAGLWST